MKIVIDTQVDAFSDALATVRAAYEKKLDPDYPACPTCGAFGKEPCVTKHGKRAAKRHTYRTSIHT